jgi:DNA-directed RNA polymerase subunit M/transcription elongation factor TFIIS
MTTTIKDQKNRREEQNSRVEEQKKRREEQKNKKTKEQKKRRALGEKNKRREEKYVINQTCRAGSAFAFLRICSHCGALLASHHRRQFLRGMF